MGRVFKQLDFGPSNEVVSVPITEGGVKGKLSVFARITGASGAASLRVFGSFVGDSSDTQGESQTLDFGDIAAADTFKLTYNTHATATLTYSADMSTAIRNALVGINEVQTITLSDFGRDISDLGTTVPEFPSQQLPLRATDKDQVRPNNTAVTGSPVDEPYALPTSGAISTGNSFKLTYNAHETAAITYSSDMSTAIKLALEGLVDFAPGDLSVARTNAYTYVVSFYGPNFGGTDAGALTVTSTVGFNVIPNAVVETTKGVAGLVDFLPGDITITKVSTSVYTVTFGGQWANRDALAFTITNQSGFTAVGVTEAAKGGTEGADLTDTAALAAAIGQVVANQENVFPYLTFSYTGDDDPDLTAEAYVIAY